MKKTQILYIPLLRLYDFEFDERLKENKYKANRRAWQSNDGHHHSIYLSPVKQREIKSNWPFASSPYVCVNYYYRLDGGGVCFVMIAEAYIQFIRKICEFVSNCFCLRKVNEGTLYYKAPFTKFRKSA